MHRSKVAIVIDLILVGNDGPDNSSYDNNNDIVLYYHVRKTTTQVCFFETSSLIYTLIDIKRDALK